jgi:hypothetical protein
MNITYREDPPSGEEISSELWSLNNLYTFGMVDLYRGSSTDMEFNPDARIYTDVQHNLPSCTLPNDLVWPSFSPQVQQLNTGSQLQLSSRTSYSTQTPTSYIPPITTSSFRRQQQPRQNEQEKQAKDKSDQSEIRCWSHNCDGRRFSSMGNYRRHLREKGRDARRFHCHDCGRSFTRSTSRNTHLQLGTCRKKGART